MIPNLTFDQFKSFHSKFYHPSNSRVYFYGDDDPLTRLELLDGYLKDFDEIPVAASKVSYQSLKKDLPNKVEVRFPVAPNTPPKHMVSLNWLLHETPLSEEDKLALGVLDTLLMGTSSSLLRKTLTESNLGESVMGGISDELIQLTFGAVGAHSFELLASHIPGLMIWYLGDEGSKAGGCPQGGGAHSFHAKESI